MSDYNSALADFTKAWHAYQAAKDAKIEAYQDAVETGRGKNRVFHEHRALS